MEFSPDAMLRLSLEGIVQSWNPGAQQLFGYSPAKIIGRHVSLLVPADRLHEPQTALEMVARGERPLPFESVRLRKDGTPIEVEISYAPIFEGGRPDAVAAVFRDISRRKQAENALRESEKRYRLVADATQTGFWDWDLDTNKVFYSAIWKDHLGHADNEIGDSFEEFRSRVHPGDIERVLAMARAAIDQPAIPYEPEFRMRHKNGTWRWIWAHGIVIRNGRGRATRMIGTHADITDRKQTQEALQASEKQLSAIYSHVSGIIFCLAVERGSNFRFISVNQAFLQTTGLAEEQVVGRLVQDVIPKASLALVQRKYREAVRTGKVVTWEEISVYPTGEKHGDVSVSPIMDETGRVTHLVGMVHDVTERKRAEQVIRESEQRFRQIAGNIHEVFWLLSADGKRQLYASPAYEEIWGRTTASLYENPKSWIQAVHKEDQPRMRAVFRKTLRTRRCSMDYRIVRPDGSIRWIHDQGFPVFDESGRLTRIAGTAEDITRRKQVEEELRHVNAELEKRVAMRTASLLSSTHSLLASSKALQRAIDDRNRLENEILDIGESERIRIGQDLHDDLGQQLAGLNWLSSVLQKELRDRAAPEAGRAARITELLEKALALTRSLARGLHPVPSESGGLMAALNQLATQSSELFGIQCRFDCRRPVGFQNPSVANHLYRIAQEAVTNAARHGRAKHIRITLAAAGKELQLSVSDDGTGLKKPRRAQGGLGMRIMNHRTETMGGSLVIEKKPDGGTRVICRVPRPAATAKKSRAATARNK